MQNKKSLYVCEHLLAFIFGFFVYGALEILWRGFTHPSMLFLGGICFLTIFMFENKLKRLHPIFRSLVYCAFITGCELMCGILLNRILGLSVWDYSEIPLNFLGQICFGFSVLWFFISVFCIFICKGIRFVFEQ